MTPEAEKHKRKKRFNDDLIRRRDIPVDCFMLLHDLCYHHEGRDVQSYVLRAQQILSSVRDMEDQGYETRQSHRNRIEASHRPTE